MTQYKQAGRFLRIGIPLLELGSSLVLAAMFVLPMYTVTNRALNISGFLFLLVANMIVIYMVLIEEFLKRVKLMTVIATVFTIIGDALCLAGAGLCYHEALTQSLPESQLPTFAVAVQVSGGLLISLGAICFVMDLCGVRAFPKSSQSNRPTQSGTT